MIIERKTEREGECKFGGGRFYNWWRFPYEMGWLIFFFFLILFEIKKKKFFLGI